MSGVAIDPVKDNGDKNLKMMTQVVIPNGLVSLPNNSSGEKKAFVMSQVLVKLFLK